MRKLAAIALGLLLLSTAARADFIDSGFFATGFIETGFFDVAAGGDVTVPNVIGQANSAAADMILEGEGLDLGAVTARCSLAAADEVVGQSPSPGVLVSLGSFVDVLVSNGLACPESGRNGVRIRGLRMPGL